MKKNYKVIIFYIVLIVVILFIAGSLLGRPDGQAVKYSDVLTLFRQEQVKSFVIDKNDELTMELQDGKTIVSYKLRDISLFYYDLGELIADQSQRGVITAYDMPAPESIPWWVSFVPYILMIVFFIVIWFFMMNQAGGKNGINAFARARTKLGSDEKKKVYFKDVAGADEEKEELEEVVEFLKNPRSTPRSAPRFPRACCS